MAEIVYPDKLQAFQNVRLTQMTIPHRVGEISTDIKDQLNSNIEKYVTVCRLQMSLQTLRFTAQLPIFIYGVTKDFQISIVLFALVSLKNQMQGSHLCNAVSDMTDKNFKRFADLEFPLIGKPQITYLFQSCKRFG